MPRSARFAHRFSFSHHSTWEPGRRLTYTCQLWHITREWRSTQFNVYAAVALILFYSVTLFFALWFICRFLFSIIFLKLFSVLCLVSLFCSLFSVFYLIFRTLFPVFSFSFCFDFGSLFRFHFLFPVFFFLDLIQVTSIGILFRSRRSWMSKGAPSTEWRHAKLPDVVRRLPKVARWPKTFRRNLELQLKVEADSQVELTKVIFQVH